MNNLEIIVKSLDEKLAKDIAVLDMTEASPLYDYFVICSSTNDRQMQALKDNVLEQTEKNGYFAKRVEGKKDSLWLLIDFGDIIVHIFDQDEREKYNLEKLWSDLAKVDIQGWLK